MHPNGQSTPEADSGTHSLLSNSSAEERFAYRYQQVPAFERDEARKRTAPAHDNSNKRSRPLESSSSYLMPYSRERGESSVTEHDDMEPASPNSGNAQIASILARLSHVEQQLAMLKSAPQAGETTPDIAAVRSLLVPPMQGKSKVYNEPYAASQSTSTPIYDDQYSQGCDDVMQSLSLRRDLSRPENPPFGMFWTYTVEETLVWPILDYHGSANSSLDALFANSDGESDEEEEEVGGSIGEVSSLRSKKARRPLVEGFRGGLDDGIVIQELIERFLKNVHIKSPILGPNDLRTRASNVVENGLSWDEQTCQVLLACALGAIYCPWDRSDQQMYAHSTPSPERYALAQEYFVGAQKRLGILYTQSSLIAAQCLYMAGMYLMYDQKPVGGWRLLNAASIACRTYISKRITRETRGLRAQHSRSMEQTICWSCFKTERAVASEFGMETSGFNVIVYSTSLPTPPNGYARAINQAPPTGTLDPEVVAQLPVHHEPFEDQSWYFFLTEIMLRKLEMRIDIYFQEKRREAYRRAGDAPEVFYQSLIAAMQEFSYQLTCYYDSLPPTMRFPLDDMVPCEDELRHDLRWRFYNVQHDIYVPALYVLVHNDISKWSSRLVGDLVKLTNACLRLDIIFLKAAVTARRHENAWLGVRKSVRSALMLIAARKLKARYRPELEALCVPDEDECRDGAHKLIQGLKYWAEEMSDCAVYLNILRSLHSDFRPDF